jgi:hypothetical protein
MKNLKDPKITSLKSVSEMQDSLRKSAKLKPISPKVNKNWKNNLFEDDLDIEELNYRKRESTLDYFDDEEE